MDVLSLVLILAIVVEKLVDLFKNLVYALPFLPTQFRPLTIEIISLALGILLAHESQINALDLLGVPTQDNIVGIIVTGLVIGKGSNFAHDFFHSFSQKDKGV